MPARRTAETRARDPNVAVHPATQSAGIKTTATILVARTARASLTEA